MASVQFSDLSKKAIEHASGMADHPMSDTALEAKFLDNAHAVVGRSRQASARMLHGLERALRT